MLASRLKPGDGAFGSTHPFSHGVLSEPGTGTCLEQLACNQIFKFEGAIRFGKPFADARRRANLARQPRASAPQVFEDAAHGGRIVWVTRK